MTGKWAVLLAIAVVPAGAWLGVASAASAQPALQAAPPQVGDCFDVSDERLQAGGWWVETPAVPCTESHTFEVTETAILPADVNAFDFAADQCGALGVWAAVGVNMPTAGIVENPLRIEARAFAVRQPPAAYVCGAVAVWLNGRSPATAVALTSSIERLGRRAAASLRYCSAAVEDRGPLAPATTVPCGSEPRWQVASWVMWTAFYDDFPGRAALRARAARLCGPGATYSLPSAASWEEGLPRTWCYRFYP